MYKIAWVSLITGYEGAGTAGMPRAVADAECTRLNQVYAGILLHWTVRLM